MKKTFIIGIAGISGSGKTTLGEYIKKRLKNTKMIHVDDYWEGGADGLQKSFEKWKKWEWPSAINFKKLYEDLIRLRNNKEYEFIIAEGFHLFYHKKIREIIDLKVYLKIPEKLVVKRRIKKFGYKDNQEIYSKEIVVKEYKKHGKPTEKYADLKFEGTESLANITKEILKSLKTNHRR